MKGRVMYVALLMAALVSACIGDKGRDCSSQIAQHPVRINADVSRRGRSLSYFMRSNQYRGSRCKCATATTTRYHRPNHRLIRKGSEQGGNGAVQG